MIAIVVAVIAAGVAIDHFASQDRGWLDDVVGTAEPGSYAIEQTRCEPGLNDVRAEGSLRNTTHETRTLAIRVRFYRRGLVIGAAYAVGADIRPGHTVQWHVGDSEPGGPPAGKLGCQVLVDEFP